MSGAPGQMYSDLRPSPAKRALETLKASLPDHAYTNELFHHWDKAHRKPGSEPNCFNVSGHGVIPVAVLGSDSLDVIDVDISTLSFGGLAVRVRGNKGPLCGYEDSNNDGMQDLVCQFEDDPSTWTVGSDAATLSGNLLDGLPFEGSDSICVVP